MGAGKTTVARAVADALGVAAIDADRVIEERAGMAIPDIFRRRGEVWFRRTEEAVVREVLSGPPAVLALGGGALESARTRGLVSRVADVVWLRASLDVAWSRVEGTARPLAVDRDRFTRRAEAREAAYAEAADLVIDADAPLDEVARRVVGWTSRGGGDRRAAGA